MLGAPSAKDRLRNAVRRAWVGDRAYYLKRSYTLAPYKLVKDATGIETTDAEGVLDGEIDEFLEAALAKSASQRGV